MWEAHPGQASHSLPSLSRSGLPSVRLQSVVDRVVDRLFSLSLKYIRTQAVRGVRAAKADPPRARCDAVALAAAAVSIQTHTKKKKKNKKKKGTLHMLRQSCCRSQMQVILQTRLWFTCSLEPLGGFTQPIQAHKREVYTTLLAQGQSWCICECAAVHKFFCGSLAPVKQ